MFRPYVCMGRIKAYINEPAIIQMIEESRRKRVTFPDLNHTALLVVDVQEHFREMASHIIFPLGAIISGFRHRACQFSTPNICIEPKRMVCSPSGGGVSSEREVEKRTFSPRFPQSPGQQ